ncbi:MAG TPA: glycosyltransferase family 4 protein [Gemmataceae bacterium]|jgi:glycosyltransferase involved in cell wall biosynthesis|nr:glycosyltransferase family 4 protein [Gemmataceae bacterium]
MKVLLASTIVPFIEGGGTFIVDWLAEKLQEYGHQVDVFKIPFHPHPGVLLEQMLALRLLGVRGYGDRLIAIRMPIYLLEHPNKVLWFIHHHRSAYDLWGTQYNFFPRGREGDALRRSMIGADEQAFRSARAIFTNSKIVSERLREHNRLDSEVLYPPLLHPEQFRSTGYGDYLFYASRITSIKRQWLAVEAMNYVRSGVRLVIAGMPDTKLQGQRLRTTLQKCDKAERVTVLDRWISEEEKQRWYAGALGALYLPYMEDSYGYPCLEAFHAEKPVITCSDSGGTLELVEDGRTGLVAEPDPRSLAEAMDRLFEERQRAPALGRRGRERIAELGISWDHVIARLTA